MNNIKNIEDSLVDYLLGQTSEDIPEFTNEQIVSAYDEIFKKSNDIKEITEDYLKDKLGRKWKSELRNIAVFIKIFNRIYCKSKFTYKPISTHSISYQSHLSSEIKNKQKALWRLLYHLKDLNIINNITDEYQFTDDKKSYCYVYNRPFANKILDLIKTNYPQVLIKSDEQIKRDIINNYLQDIDLDKYEEYSDSLKITSKTLIKIDHELSVAELKKCLIESYPYLQDFFDKVDNINATLINNDYSEYRIIKYIPKAHYSENGNITKVSLRATSLLAKFRNPEKVPEDDLAVTETRSDKLLDIWEEEGIDNGRVADTHLESRFRGVDEFDVKSSVPRVTYLLNKGIWLDNSIDIYAEMYNNGNRFKNSKVRDMYKAIFMRIYFSHSKKEAINNLCRVTNYSEEYKDFFSGLYDQTLNYLGSFYNSEIFLHESNIYILVREFLLTRFNIDAAQVYDAFFLPTDTIPRNLMYAIISICADNYYNTYILKKQGYHAVLPKSVYTDDDGVDHEYYDKSAVRKTTEWYYLKETVEENQDYKDEITGSPLRKGHVLHHLDLNEDNYGNLDSDNFISLNQMTHKMLHFCYEYYKKDPTFIIRLTKIMDKMILLNYGNSDNKVHFAKS